ncbi:ankyrin [Hypomontagnella monticulosa]|nr:ankyrin [Hypomontagnella monticulosa]
MDPLSIAAGVAQLVLFAGSLAKSLGRFIEKTSCIDKSIQELHDEISDLLGALGEIKRAFEKRPTQLPFEQKHHSNIQRIIRSCHGSLEALDQQLPQLKDENGPMVRLRQSLEHTLKDERIKEIVHHISSYKTVLQLSLTTLSLSTLWDTASSQNQIRTDIRKLTDAIQRSPRVVRGRVMERDNQSVRTQSLQSNSGTEDWESAFGKDIREWAETANDVAAAVSVLSIDNTSTSAISIPATSSRSVDTLTLCEDDNFDPEPDFPDVQNGDILKYQLDVNQKIVQGMLEGEVFAPAAAFQKKGIDQMKQLLEVEGLSEADGSSCERLMDMEEVLADILLKCDSIETDLQAREVLKRLLKGVQEEGRLDDNRKARLYHKLGDLYLKASNIGQAHKFVNRALQIRQQINPIPYRLVKESAELLVQVLRQEGAQDKAHGLLEWIQQELRQDTTCSSSISSEIMNEKEGSNVGIGLTIAYQWCKEQGMDGDNLSSCDPATGTTPMHRVIQMENIEVLRHMLSNVCNVEQRDSCGSTPLHIAAAKRNHKLCALLFEHSADANVVDHNGMTPLHRCQSGKGGVAAAEMLLQHCPSLIDRVDNFGKTALYMACEKGNKKMVKSLLTNGRATPNVVGQGKCIPLIAAIDLAAKIACKIVIVELLLLHGADPNIPEADGRTAFMAAKNAGLAGEQIRRILNTIPPKTVRKISTATSSTNSSGSGRRTSSNSLAR